MKVASCVLLQMHPEMPDLKPHWVEAAELDEAVEKFMDDLIEKKHYEFQTDRRRRESAFASAPRSRRKRATRRRMVASKSTACPAATAELLLGRSDIKYVVTHEGDEFYVVGRADRVDRRMVLHPPQRAADLQKRVHGAGGSDVDLQTLTSEEFVQFAKILALVVEHARRTPTTEHEEGDRVGVVHAKRQNVLHATDARETLKRVGLVDVDANII